jgi:hypothetical protein
VHLQNLFLILSQGVDLGLLSITAAFSAAGDFEKILGSGFEMIRISQCESLCSGSEPNQTDTFSPANQPEQDTYDPCIGAWSLG